MDERDNETLDQLIEEIYSNIDPQNALLGFMIDIEKRQETRLIIGLFEGLIARISINNYWIFAIAATAYSNAGEETAAFLTSQLALQIDPTSSAGPILNAYTFSYLVRHCRMADAVHVCLASLELFPAAPVATSETLRPIAEAAGIILPHNNRPHDDQPKYQRQVVVAESVRKPLMNYEVFGGATPNAIQALGSAAPRPAISVYKLINAELLILDQQIAVMSSDGTLLSEISISAFPQHVASYFKREGNADTYETIELDEAVVVSDRWPQANYCHFLLDQMPRLALYEKVGIDIGDVTVIGPEATASFQKSLICEFGITKYIGTGRRLKLRVRDLWLSSDSVNTLHHAYYGSPWVIDFIRPKLIARSAAGHRRLYVSRNEGLNRRIVNEHELLPVLKHYDFTLINPGLMTVKAQIETFREASHVVGPHGAAMANIVFAPDNLRFLEIFHPLYSNTAYAQLTDALNMHYAAISGRDGQYNSPEYNDASHMSRSLSDGSWASRSIYVDPNDLSRWLERSVA